MSVELTANFFKRSPIDCARDLVGCQFYWGGCGGIIVETEAYLEQGDPACHTFNRPSARSFIENHEAGAAYVYLNYGVHWLFNILTKNNEGAGFVLFRALEPTTGLDLMSRRRGSSAIADLCSGPGKLTQALEIDGRIHGVDLFDFPEPVLAMGNGIVEVRSSGRIGISRAQEKPWRFGSAGSLFLSKPLI